MSTPNAVSVSDSGPGNHILQFWDSNTPDYISSLLTTVEAHSGFMDYRFFDDEAAREFLTKNHGSRVVELYDNCAMAAMKADLFRYCYLYSYGGMYIDADYRCIAPLTELIEKCDRGLFYKMLSQSNGDIGLCNGLMYFKWPQDTLAGKFVDKALENIEKRVSNSVWALTGPAVMRDVLSGPDSESLLEGISIVDDDTFGKYLKAVVGLQYKQTDKHWHTAKKKGISAFKD